MQDMSMQNLLLANWVKRHHVQGRKRPFWGVFGTCLHCVLPVRNSKNRYSGSVPCTGVDTLPTRTLDRSASHRRVN